VDPYDQDSRSNLLFTEKKVVTMQAKDRGLGVSPEELSCAGRQKQRFAHRPKQMCAATHVVFAEHQVQDWHLLDGHFLRADSTKKLQLAWDHLNLLNEQTRLLFNNLRL